MWTIKKYFTTLHTLRIFGDAFTEDKAIRFKLATPRKIKKTTVTAPLRRASEISHSRRTTKFK